MKDFNLYQMDDGSGDAKRDIEKIMGELFELINIMHSCDDEECLSDTAEYIRCNFDDLWNRSKYLIESEDNLNYFNIKDLDDRSFCMRVGEYLTFLQKFHGLYNVGGA